MSTPSDSIARNAAGRPAADPAAPQATSTASPGGASATPGVAVHGDKLAGAAQAAAGGAAPTIARQGPAAASEPGPAAPASAAQVTLQGPMAAFNHQLVRDVNAVLERHGIFLGDDRTAPDFSGLLRAHTVQLAHTLVLMQQHGIEPARIEKTIQQIANKLPKGIRLVNAALAVIEAERLAAEAQDEFLRTS